MSVRSISARALALGAIAAVTMVTTAGTAVAHERRTVGAYQFVVGWGDEPTYAGFNNSVELILSHSDGSPAPTSVTG